MKTKITIWFISIWIIVVVWLILRALPTVQNSYAETPTELRDHINYCTDELHGYATFDGDKENGWKIRCEYKDKIRCIESD